MNGGRNVVRRYTVIQPEQTKVELLVGQREVELLLRLRQRIRVGRRRPSADLFGNAQGLRKLVDLRLVQMRDRLQVGGAIAVLDEEALVVFEAIGRADDRVLEAIGVVVLRSSSARAA